MFKRSSETRICEHIIFTTTRYDVNPEDVTSGIGVIGGDGEVDDLSDVDAMLYDSFLFVSIKFSRGRERVTFFISYPSCKTLIHFIV